LIGRTTLIIAHRLSTIRNADKIIVIQKGEVIEEGDHDSLMRAKSTYFGLVEQQILRQAEEEEELELKRQETTRALSSVQEDQYLIEQQIRRSIADGGMNLAVPDLYGKKNSKVDVELNENEGVTVKVIKRTF
jgi:ABC-type multidrug transport system ATPase subunit